MIVFKCESKALEFFNFIYNTNLTKEDIDTNEDDFKVFSHFMACEVNYYPQEYCIFKNIKKQNTNYVIAWRKKNQIGDPSNLSYIKTCKPKEARDREYNYLDFLMTDKKSSEHQIIATGRNMNTIDMIYMDFDKNANIYLKPVLEEVRSEGLPITGYIISNPRSSEPHFQLFMNLNQYLDRGKDKVIIDFIFKSLVARFSSIGLDENFKGLQARNPGCTIGQDVYILQKERLSLLNLIEEQFDWCMLNGYGVPQEIYDKVNGGHVLGGLCNDMSTFLGQKKERRSKKEKKEEKKKILDISIDKVLPDKDLNDHPYKEQLLSLEAEMRMLLPNCDTLTKRLRFYCYKYNISSRNTAAFYSTRSFLRDLELDGYIINLDISKCAYEYYEYFSLLYNGKSDIESYREMKASIKGVLSRASKEAAKWPYPESEFKIKSGSSEYTEEQRKKGHETSKYKSNLVKISIKHSREIEGKSWQELDYSKPVISRAMKKETSAIVNEIIDYLSSAIICYNTTKDIALKRYLFDNIIGNALSLGSKIEDLIGYLPDIFKEIEQIITSEVIDITQEVKDEIVDVISISLPIFRDCVNKIFDTGEIEDINSLISSKTANKHDLTRVS